ncbi:MAG: hypothetical protein Cons2KO_08550 [Congregibacter sp.]
MNPVDQNINNIRTQRTDIDQSSRRSSDSARTGGVGSAGNAAGAGPAAGADASTEAVTFTQTAADLLALETQLRELPGIDQARVDSIRQAIDNGSYEIDAQRIVDNLLQSERELS